MPERAAGAAEAVTRVPGAAGGVTGDGIAASARPENGGRRPAGCPTERLRRWCTQPFHATFVVALEGAALSFAPVFEPRRPALRGLPPSSEISAL